MIDDNSLYAEVGKLICNARKKRKLTQEGLGRAVSLTRTSITNIERGRQKLLLHTLARIADVLGLPIAQLLPDNTSTVDELLTRVLEKRSEPERDWIRLALRSLPQKGTG